MTPAPLHDWATRWALPAECVTDLLTIMGAVPSPPATMPDSRTSEAYVQSLVRLEAPRYGVWLTRNNVGARKLVDEKTGQTRLLRWGLANESEAQNRVIKSGDLIGIDGRPIEPWEVGLPRGRLVSRECKHGGWSGVKDEHERAQLSWATLVTRYGGDAKFVTGEGSFG